MSKKDAFGFENPCSRCIPSKCCLYTAIQVQGPRSRADFDDMFWHISHEAIEYFVDGGKWYMMVHSRCSHLTEDNLCGIYENRFRVCREHPNTNCEFHSDYGFDLHFRTYAELKAYAEERWEKNRRGLAKARKGKKGGRRPAAERRGKPSRKGSGEKATP